MRHHLCNLHLSSLPAPHRAKRTSEKNCRKTVRSGACFRFSLHVSAFFSPFIVSTSPDRLISRSFFSMPGISPVTRISFSFSETLTAGEKLLPIIPREMCDPDLPFDEPFSTFPSGRGFRSIISEMEFRQRDSVCVEGYRRRNRSRFGFHSTETAIQIFEDNFQNLATIYRHHRLFVDYVQNHLSTGVNNSQPVVVCIRKPFKQLQ